MSDLSENTDSDPNHCLVVEKVTEKLLVSKQAMHMYGEI
jgi:hypothetical protein